MYYKISNFRYVKSRNDAQLRDYKKSNTTTSCDPERFTADGKPIVPCGLIAWSLFNDTYSFTRGKENLTVNKKDISWKSDREHKFAKNVYPSNFQNGALIGGKKLNSSIPVCKFLICTVFHIYVGYNCSLTIYSLNILICNNGSFEFFDLDKRSFSGYGIPVKVIHVSSLSMWQLSEQEDLIVWMRTAALPTFRKLYGRIYVDLKANDTITVRLSNNYNTYSFGGKKKLVLSTATWLGGKNDFLGFAYLIVGGLCIFLAFAFTLLYLIKPRLVAFELRSITVKYC